MEKTLSMEMGRIHRFNPRALGRGHLGGRQELERSLGPCDGIPETGMGNKNFGAGAQLVEQRLENQLVAVVRILSSVRGTSVC